MRVTKNIPPPPMTYEAYKANRIKIAKDVKDPQEEQQNFLNLLMVQLKNQDPLKPLDNTEFVQQMTSFSQLEQMIAMNKSLASLLESNNSKVDLGQAANVIGKKVQFDTNVAMVTDTGNSNISFYSSASAGKTTVNLYNSNKQFVGKISLNGINAKDNTLKWDGKTDSGVKLPPGKYTFDIVVNNDEERKNVSISTYGEQVVKGVKLSQGKMYYETEAGNIPSDSIYSIVENDSKESLNTKG